MLELTDVDAFYGNSRALQGINLMVGNGEFLSVLGRNGVGKTTLMRSILGLMDRCTGRLSLDGADISPLRTYQRAKAGIAYVPQGRGILPRFTVRENLTLGTFAAKSANGIEEWVLELFPVLKDFLNRYGGNLSGGQQQQLAIARALLAKPKVILLDEPTEGIQPNIVEQIEDVIVSLNRERGITVVLVEQNVAFARRASHRFALLEKGRVVAKGAIGELTDDLIQLHMAV
ncbi:MULTISPECIES: urea ABC transporter ATP-binding subunit UrtE [Bradyrhizobium]|uniref:Amino acid/amide ABC transporter ATP-binding protein 2, HAAT family n=1 Tax=Bradyrhizobium brasilense TaxID=1419277 RepID=A0A1R1QDS1_9BRAD|nr:MULTISPECIES: urea ABC transporter ATP-binding subunit UrtE [Bradyrhizobium]MCP1908099.1 urea transport system ATP-binding protein [Bradyrhizobium elkanii]MCC8944285.1 urea ABC transporter ATP-binding subunit UrtE [Bradyrhizobium brasilense]MCC8969273.1 urea ABC transporter ATP-binding subunit UrtE [Bradyrhizobium brasilense]MCP1837217.1 urea transport system ATP-binding protein [Bradyrhizobium sp. USDA 4538]MCP1853374.1 urea transport system ATP-binding protein [Bradyrhizobium sp. USDA 454